MKKKKVRECATETNRLWSTHLSIRVQAATCIKIAAQLCCRFRHRVRNRPIDKPYCEVSTGGTWPPRFLLYHKSLTCNGGDELPCSRQTLFRPWQFLNNRGSRIMQQPMELNHSSGGSAWVSCAKHCIWRRK